MRTQRFRDRKVRATITCTNGDGTTEIYEFNREELAKLAQQAETMGCVIFTQVNDEMAKAYEPSPQFKTYMSHLKSELRSQQDD